MTTLGIDIGNYNVKTSTGEIFDARYSMKDELLEGNSGIEINSIIYNIGAGTFETKLDKAEKQNILPLLYTAIIRSTKDSVVNIVLGLPIGQYRENKDKFKYTISTKKMINVKYKGIEKSIIIDNIEIFPEGAGAYYSMENKPDNCIMLDIGGRTTNIVNFENKKITKFDSKVLGMLNIYSNIRDAINSKYSLDIKTEQIADILKNGLLIDGEKIDMSFIKPIMNELIDQLMNELNLNYPIRTQEVILTGGGSLFLYGTLQKRITRISRLENYLFANAEGFKKVGDQLWKEEE